MTTTTRTYKCWRCADRQRVTTDIGAVDCPECVTPADDWNDDLSDEERAAERAWQAIREQHLFTEAGKPVPYPTGQVA